MNSLQNLTQNSNLSSENLLTNSKFHQLSNGIKKRGESFIDVLRKIEIFIDCRDFFNFLFNIFQFVQLYALEDDDIFPKMKDLILYLKKCRSGTHQCWYTHF